MLLRFSLGPLADHHLVTLCWTHSTPGPPYVTSCPARPSQFLALFLFFSPELFNLLLPIIIPILPNNLDRK